MKQSVAHVRHQERLWTIVCTDQGRCREMDDSIEMELASLASAERDRSFLLVKGLGGAVCLTYMVNTALVFPWYRRSQVCGVLRLLQGRKGTVVDLGSGDGRLVCAVATQGFRADGYELNPFLLGYSRLLAHRKGLASLARFHRRDLFKADLKQYSNIVIYGEPVILRRLEQKLAEEVTSGSRVICCRYKLPTWAPTTTLGEGIETIYVYDKV
ncbi:ATP synthase subunit C lysine N-methyltransferase-like isoform X3 [Branchiostoma floridae]|uniref:ATP synthase subunit C lysine N-methyltransferase-like isoform X3 n=1 Tax=Branchiostoma floridae TaxID=7739 RepID=A0A9J7LCX4_BRAFL|nr:ATP synthase subunit C lysine N-methyltransferase-like isoform X3 [Branchiostoma floridae]